MKLFMVGTILNLMYKQEERQNINEDNKDQIEHFDLGKRVESNTGSGIII